MKAADDLDDVMSSDAARAIALLRMGAENGQRIPPVEAVMMPATAPASRGRGLLRWGASAGLFLAVIVVAMGVSYRQQALVDAEWHRIALDKATLADDLQRLVDEKTALVDEKTALADEKTQWADKVKATIVNHLDRAKQLQEKPGDQIIVMMLAGDLIKEAFPDDDALLSKFETTRHGVASRLLAYIWPDGVPPDLLDKLAQQEGSQP